MGLLGTEACGPGRPGVGEPPPPSQGPVGEAQLLWWLRAQVSGQDTPTGCWRDGPAFLPPPPGFWGRGSWEAGGLPGAAPPRAGSTPLGPPWPPEAPGPCPSPVSYGTGGWGVPDGGARPTPVRTPAACGRDSGAPSQPQSPQPGPAGWPASSATAWGHPGRPRKGRGSFLYRNEFMGRVHVTPSPGTLESREGAQDLKGSPQAPGCLPKGGGCPPDGRLGSGPWEGTRPLSTVRSHSPGWGLRDGLGSVFRPGRGPLLLNGFPGGCWPTAWGRGLGAKRSLEATCQGASDFLGQAVS